MAAPSHTTQHQPPFSPPTTGNISPISNHVSPNAGYGGRTAHGDLPALPGLEDLSPMYVSKRYWSYETLHPRADLPSFLKKDFDVSRLDAIHDKLWWAGREVPPHPLHRLRMEGRALVLVEQADLHLVWSEETVFLKPLPDFLLDHSFWLEYICPDADLYAMAQGFLLSWCWLLRYRSDFAMAQEKFLVPEKLKWSEWTDFVDRLWFNIDPNHPEPISKRYTYGELRLTRLNQIYRFHPSYWFKWNHLIRGYLFGYSSYIGFFRREFAWLIVAFAYLSIILSAMQVGLTTSNLEGNENFNKSSAGFAVATIIFPMAISVIALAIYLVLWIVNVTWTKHSQLTRKKQVKAQQQDQAQQITQRQSPLPQHPTAKTKHTSTTKWEREKVARV